MKNGSKAVVQHGRATDWQEVGHDEDARLDACLTQRYTLLDITDRQPGCTLLDKCAGDLNGTMSVCIGFDDWHDFDLRANHFSYAAVVSCDNGSRDFHP